VRILLAQNSQYYPAYGGGDKSNRLLMEGLAARSHVCEVVARAAAMFGEEVERKYLEELARRGVAPLALEAGLVRLALNGVGLRVVTGRRNLRAGLSGAIEEFDPDVILLSTDDPAQIFLEAALKAKRAALVYLVRTTLALPFGPEAAFASQEKAERLRLVDAVVGVSRYVADYVRRWGGIAAEALPISPLEAGPYRELGRWDNEFVTMVNPCAVKGIAIFLGLADALPEVRFAAVPTWGTTQADLEALKSRRNITVIEPADDIERILERTRVLLVPSLWAEARGRIVVEAWLRGVPVLAANVGGIPEAMMGLEYLLPVRPILRYRHQLDEQMVPVADVPGQDVRPWKRALEELLADRDRYERLSREGRRRALEYAAGLSVEPLERLLERVVSLPRRRWTAASRPVAASVTENPGPNKRALLAAHLRRRAAEGVDRWFPGLRPGDEAQLRLFCFPYAGGGAAVFRGWAARLAPRVAVCPARLPGREARILEPPAKRIEELVSGLMRALATEVVRPYALFGHSMGALVAFELARRLLRDGQPGPRALLVAAARAPQLRRSVAGPEPGEQELLEELERLGVGKEVFESEDLRRLVLPALRADVALCRAYVYEPGPKLSCPITVYAGAEDARLALEALEAWREQTTGEFRLRWFTGGHLFLHTAEEELIRALQEDLERAQAGN
jgi:surfactin synthase thioesterase subunit/glycosyltransferase involved in cell wall biosynthesis